MSHAITRTEFDTVRIKSNDNGEYQFLLEDGSTDITDSLMALCAELEANGIGGRIVIKPRNPSGGEVTAALISKKLTCYASNVTVDFSQVVLLFTASGSLRLAGSLSEYGPRSGNGCTLRSASTVDGSGKLVLPLTVGHAASLSVGMKIVVRGQNDVTGRTLEKQVTFIESIVGDDVTCVDEPLATFQPTYPGSDWPADLTTGTTIFAVSQMLMLADVNASGSLAQYVTVSISGFIFSVGDLVQLSDSSTEDDVIEYQTPGHSVPSAYRNAARMEFRRITSIVNTGAAYQLWFDRPVKGIYQTAKNASVGLVAPTVNSHLIARDVQYTALQSSSYKSLEIVYGDRCSVTLLGKIYGTGYRIGDAMRCTYSHDCRLIGGPGAVIDGAGGYAGAMGYGATLYYSTNCGIVNLTAQGCRHNFLIAACTDWYAYDVVSRDDVVSGFDVHGSNSNGGHIKGLTVSKAEDLTDGSTYRRDLAGVSTSGGLRIGNYSHVAGDKNITVEGFTSEGYRGGAAIDVLPSSGNVTIISPHIKDTDVPWRFGTVNPAITPTQTFTGLTISGAVIERCGAPYVHASAAGKLKQLVITDYTEIGCAGHIDLVAANSGDIDDVTIDGYRIVAPVAASGVHGLVHGLELTNVTNATVRNCDLRKANRGLKLTNCTNVDALDNNRFDAPVDGAQYDYVSAGANTNVQVRSKPTGQPGGAIPPELMPSVRIGPMGVATNTNAELTTGTLFMQPIYVPERMTLTKLSVRCTTFAGAANVRLGLYSNTGSHPGARLVDSGDVAVSGTGLIEATISQFVQPGRYWLAMSTDAAGNFFNCVNACDGQMGRSSTSTSSAAITGFYRTFTHAALPADESAQSYSASSATGTMPILLVG